MVACWLAVPLVCLPDAALAARSSMRAPLEPQPEAYMRARLAEADGDAQLAASAYRLALDGDPANISVALRGYRQALIAGDMPLALRAARALKANGTAPRDAVLLSLIDAFARRDVAEVRNLADQLVAEEQLAFMAPYARSWASVLDGSYDPPVIASNDPFAVYSLRHLDDQIMLQRLAMGDGPGASEALRAALDRGVVYPPSYRLTLASRFAELGQRESALLLLSDDRPETYGELRRKIESGAPVPAVRITPSTGMAMLIGRLAGDLAGGGNVATTLILFRMASFADPANIAIRMDVARALLAGGYPVMAFEEAGKVPVTSSIWFDAQNLRVAALARQGRAADAVAYARSLLLRPGAGTRELRMLGEAHLQNGDNAEAVEALGRALALSEGQADARLLLQYGGALVESGRWAEGKAQLEQALALVPDSAVVLNHLGYSLAERGEELPRAIALLEQATKIAPDEPAYIDSLGWVYYRAGQAAKALPLLEKAVLNAPGEPEINEHLGDVLWTLGRRFEARHAWTAAAVYAEGAVKARITRKLERGLERP